MKRMRRITAGRGSVNRSERTTRSKSASTISAFPSMTSRSARRSGTIVNGSNEAFSARQPTIKHSSWANPPTIYRWYSTTTRMTRLCCNCSEGNSGEKPRVWCTPIATISSCRPLPFCPLKLALSGSLRGLLAVPRSARPTCHPPAPGRPSRAQSSMQLCAEEPASASHSGLPEPRWQFPCTLSESGA